MKVEILSPTAKLKTLKHAPPGAVEVDEVVVVNTRVCIAYEDLDANEEGMFVHAAPLIKGDKAAVAITEGDTAYWDAGASVFTNVDGGGANIKCGMFSSDAAVGDAEAELELDNSVNL